MLDSMSCLSMATSLLNPFLCIKNNGYLYLQRVSQPLKKRCDVFSEGNAAHPVGCASLCR
jgi:hypothetical protein